CFSDGLVPPDNIEAFAQTALALLDNPRPEIEIPWRFQLEAQTETTLKVYENLLARRPAHQ
ncbi:MAG: glycosyl transferase, partial [Marinobacter sp.]